MSRRTVRRIKNGIAISLAVVATLIGLLCLGAILWTLLKNGFSGLSWAVFSEMTPPPGESGGGLLNAIFGSAVMTLLGIVIGAPVGILAGTYLAEYGRGSRISSVIRFINDVLLSAPSIIVGLFVYELLVIRMGHFSALAGGVALSILAIPVMVRTTEDMLRLVPQGMKDASRSRSDPAVPNLSLSPTHGCQQANSGRAEVECHGQAVLLALVALYGMGQMGWEEGHHARGRA